MKTISIAQRRLYMQDAFAAHAAVSPFGIYEILMAHTRDMNPRKRLGVGGTGNEGVAAIRSMVEMTERTAGRLEMAGANSALEERGVPTELELPNYGYVRSSIIFHGGIDNALYNELVDGNPDGLTHVGRRGGAKARGRPFANGHQNKCVRVDTA